MANDVLGRAINGPAVIGPKLWNTLPKQPTTTPAAPAGAIPLAVQHGGVALAGNQNVVSHLMGGAFGRPYIGKPGNPGSAPLPAPLQSVLDHHAQAEHPAVTLHPTVQGTAVHSFHSVK